MSDKPSLYVVEKKEVVILVVLFVLVTLLSFTVGVKYGESLGRKANIEEKLAEKENDAHKEIHGGSLGDVQPNAVEEKHEAHAKANDHGTQEKVDHDSHNDGHTVNTNIITKDKKKNISVDNDSDEYLLSALKEAGVQPPSDKTESATPKLPEETKAVKAGSYVIQIGSFPTKKDAEQQERLYRSKKLDVSIMSPIKDKQGEWYRVSVGSYSNKSDAEKAARKYKDKGLIKSYFVRRVN